MDSLDIVLRSLLADLYHGDAFPAHGCDEFGNVIRLDLELEEHAGYAVSAVAAIFQRHQTHRVQA